MITTKKDIIKKINSISHKKITDLNNIFINHKSSFKEKNLLDLKGKIKFLPDYDYKKLREGLHKI